MTLVPAPALSSPPLTLGRVIVLVHDDACLAFYRAAFGARVWTHALTERNGDWR